MGKIKGIDFQFVVGGTPFTYCKTFNYSLGTNLVETTQLVDGLKNTYQSCGGHELTGSLEGYIQADIDSSLGFGYLLHTMHTDATLGYQFKPLDASIAGYFVLGTVSITDLKVTNPGNKDFMTFSCDMKGDWDVSTR